MPLLPSREVVLNSACRLVGRSGRAFGVELRRPVFIIGTGRCGTTLLIKILGSHPRLVGFPSEANELWHPKLEPFESASIDLPPIEIDPRKFTEVSVTNWPSGYDEVIRDTFSGFHILNGSSKTFFTKSAMISFMIPNILSIFPDARIIHIFRFAPSVVESYFKKNFGKYSRYVYPDQEYRAFCANYWNACILEIEKRKNELRLVEKRQFLEFSYESLCANPRAILDDISNFVGVDPSAFRFDLSTIASHNDKAPDYATDPERAALLETMTPGMRLKGYAVT